MPTLKKIKMVGFTFHFSIVAAVFYIFSLIRATVIEMYSVTFLLLHSSLFSHFNPIYIIFFILKTSCFHCWHEALYIWVNNLSSFLTQLSFRLQSRQHLLNTHDLLIHRNRYFFFNLVYITVCRYFVITNIIKYIRKQICVPACVTVTLSQLNWCTDFNENHWDTSILKQGTILTMLQISFIDNRPKYLLY